MFISNETVIHVVHEVCICYKQLRETLQLNQTQTTSFEGKCQILHQVYVPLSLWPPGWWGGHCQGPRRYILPHVHAPATRLCTPLRPPPRHGPSGHWSSWRSTSRPGWDAPSSPTPCGLQRSSHSTYRWKYCTCKLNYGCSDNSRNSVK